MEFNSKKISKVIQCLLAPTWAERRAADNILMMLLWEHEKDRNGRWTGIIGEAIDSIDVDLDTFLSALISFWADSTAIQYQKRMESFSSDSTIDFRNCAWLASSIERFPLQDSMNLNRGMYGSGIGNLLEGIGPKAEKHVKQLAACLQHPEVIVQDSAVEALGAIGVGARSVLEDVMTSIRAKGVWCRPFRPAISASRIIGDDKELALHIASTIDPVGENHAVAGTCAVLRRLSKKNSELLNILREKYLLAIPENKAAIICAGSELAERFDCSEAEFFNFVIEQSKSNDSILRESAARASGYFAKFDQTENILIELTADHEWTVRFNAHYSAENISSPSKSLIQNVVNDIGNYDGFDGLPHDAAVSTIAKWGKCANSAIPKIKAWIDTLLVPSYVEESDVSTLLELVESFGTDLSSIKPTLEKFVNKCTQVIDVDESENEIDEDVESDAEIMEMTLNQLPGMTAELQSELTEITVELQSELNELEENNDLMQEQIKQFAIKIGLPMGCFSETEFDEEDCVEEWEKLQIAVKELKESD